MPAALLDLLIKLGELLLVKAAPIALRTFGSEFGAGITVVVIALVVLIMCLKAADRS